MTKLFAFLAARVEITPTALKNLALAAIAMFVLYGRLPQSNAEAITGLVLAALAFLRTKPTEAQTETTEKP